MPGSELMSLRMKSMKFYFRFPIEKKKKLEEFKAEFKLCVKLCFVFVKQMLEKNLIEKATRKTNKVKKHLKNYFMNKKKA
jgi:hypothetical protein